MKGTVQDDAHGPTILHWVQDTTWQQGDQLARRMGCDHPEQVQDGLSRLHGDAADHRWCTEEALCQVWGKGAMNA